MKQEIISFEDAVKLRLKSIVAELIPEERWDVIVQQTVSDFQRNDLPKLVKEELTIRYKKALNDELSKPEWQPQWENNMKKAAPELKKLLVETAPLAFASMMEIVANNVLQEFRNSIQRY